MARDEHFRSQGKVFFKAFEFHSERASECIEGIKDYFIYFKIVRKGLSELVTSLVPVRKDI